MYKASFFIKKKRKVCLFDNLYGSIICHSKVLWIYSSAIREKVWFLEKITWINVLGQINDWIILSCYRSNILNNIEVIKTIFEKHGELLFVFQWYKKNRN